MVFIIAFLIIFFAVIAFVGGILLDKKTNKAGDDFEIVKNDKET